MHDHAPEPARRWPKGVWAACIFALAALPAWGEEDRRIDTWLVSGTFDHAAGADFEKDFLCDETTICPTEGMISGGKPWRLLDDRLYCRNMDDYNDLYTFYSAVRPGSPGEPTEGHIAYAHTYVWSPSRRDEQLRIGSNDGYRVWLNGTLLRSDASRMRRALRDQDRVPVTLEKGWNRLMLKVANGHGIWGFYAYLCTSDGRPLSGLAYSVSPPGGPLTVVTKQLPLGYAAQPFVGLKVAGTPPASNVPSASPFRLMASGGTPPYRWAPSPKTPLPPGFWLDGFEGELHGICPAPGRYALEVWLHDAKSKTAQARWTLTVAERPTRWLEEEKIGGLIHGHHGGSWSHGDPHEQARLMAREGYAYAAQTTGWFIGKDDWPGYYKPGVGARKSGISDYSAYATAFRDQGVRFGAYVGLPDAERTTFDGKDFIYWPRYLDGLHATFQAMSQKYRPVVFYLDGIAQANRLEDPDLAEGATTTKRGWDLDAQFSLIKTLDPDCIVMANSNRDDLCGDADIINFEGSNDAEAYWSRWPQGQSGRNPKFVPVASWRYPFSWAMWEGTSRARFRKPGQPDAYQDWDEWVRVMVSLIAEGFIVDLDHSFGFEREEMHARIGDWLQPRLASLAGTRPGPLESADWGYNVRRGGTLYLHLLRNGRGKTGWSDGKTLKVGPFHGANVTVRRFPQKTPIPFTRDGSSLLIEMEGVPLDPVDTIIAIEGYEDPAHVP